jgi:hypothetical protein
MAENSGEVQVYNPDKQISEQVTLKNIVTHDSAMKLSRTGVPELPSETPITPNQRMKLRFKGLNEIISAQQCMVTNIKAIVKNNSEVQWKKRNKSKEEKIKNKFDDDDNDYNELVAILYFLDICEQKIITSRKTKMPEDDFITKRQDNIGEWVLELTKNFFEMMKELEESYEETYSIMLRNKIVSSGFTVDEELEDKQKEEEAMRRIIES